MSALPTLPQETAFLSNVTVMINTLTLQSFEPRRFEVEDVTVSTGSPQEARKPVRSEGGYRLIVRHPGLRTEVVAIRADLRSPGCEAAFQASLKTAVGMAAVEFWHHISWVEIAAVLQ